MEFFDSIVEKARKANKRFVCWLIGCAYPMTWICHHQYQEGIGVCTRCRRPDEDHCPKCLKERETLDQTTT